MDDITKQRYDLTSSVEDFERVMEDYFGVFATDLNSFLTEKTIGLKYDDIETTMSFYFDNEWDLDDFMENLMDSPTTNAIYHFEEWSNVDREKLTLRVDGKMGGLT